MLKDINDQLWLLPVILVVRVGIVFVLLLSWVSIFIFGDELCPGINYV